MYTAPLLPKPSPCAGRRLDWGGGWILRGGPRPGRRRVRRSWRWGRSTRPRPTGGRMPAWCTASPPAPSPSPRSQQRPQLGGPRSRTPPNPRDAFAKALGAISPALDRQGTVCCLCSSVDLGNRSSVDLVAATAARTRLECR